MKTNHKGTYLKSSTALILLASLGLCILGSGTSSTALAQSTSTTPINSQSTPTNDLKCTLDKKSEKLKATEKCETESVFHRFMQSLINQFYQFENNTTSQNTTTTENAGGAAGNGDAGKAVVTVAPGTTNSLPGAAAGNGTTGALLGGAAGNSGAGNATGTAGNGGNGNTFITATPGTTGGLMVGVTGDGGAGNATGAAGNGTTGALLGGAAGNGGAGNAAGGNSSTSSQLGGFLGHGSTGTSTTQIIGGGASNTVVTPNNGGTPTNDGSVTNPGSMAGGTGTGTTNNPYATNSVTNTTTTNNPYATNGGTSTGTTSNQQTSNTGTGGSKTSTTTITAPVISNTLTATDMSNSFQQTPTGGATVDPNVQSLVTHSHIQDAPFATVEITGPNSNSNSTNQSSSSTTKFGTLFNTSPDADKTSSTNTTSSSQQTSTNSPVVTKNTAPTVSTAPKIEIKTAAPTTTGTGTGSPITPQTQNFNSITAVDMSSSFSQPQTGGTTVDPNVQAFVNSQFAHSQPFTSSTKSSQNSTTQSSNNLTTVVVPFSLTPDQSKTSQTPSSQQTSTSSPVVTKNIAPTTPKIEIKTAAPTTTGTGSPITPQTQNFNSLTAVDMSSSNQQAQTGSTTATGTATGQLPPAPTQTGQTMNLFTFAQTTGSYGNLSVAAAPEKSDTIFLPTGQTTSSTQSKDATTQTGQTSTTTPVVTKNIAPTTPKIEIKTATPTTTGTGSPITPQTQNFNSLTAVDMSSSNQQAQTGSTTATGTATGQLPPAPTQTAQPMNLFTFAQTTGSFGNLSVTAAPEKSETIFLPTGQSTSSTQSKDATTQTGQTTDSGTSNGQLLVQPNYDTSATITTSSNYEQPTTSGSTQQGPSTAATTPTYGTGKFTNGQALYDINKKFLGLINYQNLTATGSLQTYNGYLYDSKGAVVGALINGKYYTFNGTQWMQCSQGTATTIIYTPIKQDPVAALNTPKTTTSTTTNTGTSSSSSTRAKSAPSSSAITYIDEDSGTREDRDSARDQGRTSSVSTAPAITAPPPDDF